MAEILIAENGTPGSVKTLFVLRRRSDAAYYYVTGSAWESYNAAHIAGYEIAATEIGTATGVFKATNPDPNTEATADWIERAGGSLVQTDLSNGLFGSSGAGPVTAQLADAVTHGGTTAKLRLGSTNSTPAFYVTNSNGHAVEFQSTKTAFAGFYCEGPADGYGMWAVGLDGIFGQGATSGGRGFASQGGVGSTADTNFGTQEGTLASVTALGVAYDFAKGTVAMTEAYAADGAAPTPAQAFFMIWSLLAERSISGTTLTAKKLDGSTSAMVFTLDSASLPTSQTRSA